METNGSWISRSMSALRAKVSEFGLGLAQVLNALNPIHFFVLLGRALRRWFIGLWEMWLGAWDSITNSLQSFWQNRRMNHLAWGSPALIAGVAVIYGAGVLSTASEFVLVGGYEQRFNSAYFEERNFASAELAARRLLNLREENQQYHYFLALASAALEQKERAAAILAWLAPVDRQGYGLAHFTVGRQLHAELGKSLDPRRLPIAFAQLNRALVDNPENLAAHGMLADLFVASNNLAEAQPHIEKAAELRPELRLKLAEYYVQRNMPEKVKLEAEHCRGIFTLRLQRNLDDVQSRSLLAASLLLLNDHEGAIKLWEEGLLRSPTNVGFKKNLAATYMFVAQKLATGKNVDFQRYLEMVLIALKHDPAQPAALQQLIAISSAKNAAADQARKALQEMLTSGRATATCHLLLGMGAAQRNDIPKSTFHFEQAFKLDPKQVDAANNLAWALSRSQPPQLERALSLINSTLAEQPSAPHFLETRGQILTKLKRFREALVDLEKALPQLPRAAEIHDALATCYDGIGDQEMARLHRAHAALIRPTEAVALPK